MVIGLDIVMVIVLGVDVTEYAMSLASGTKDMTLLG
jgi:hypothetical protein